MISLDNVFSFCLDLLYPCPHQKVVFIFNLLLFGENFFFVCVLCSLIICYQFRSEEVQITRISLWSILNPISSHRDSALHCASVVQCSGCSFKAFEQILFDNQKQISHPKPKPLEQISNCESNDRFNTVPVQYQWPYFWDYNQHKDKSPLSHSSLTQGP